MKNWLIRVIALTALVLIGLWVWHTFFPSQEKVIRARLLQVARLASFDSKESNLGRLAAVAKLGDYFTTDADCIFSSADTGRREARGRDELRAIAFSARSMTAGFQVRFIDIAVAVSPDKQSATANLTIRVSLPGDRDFVVDEAKFTLLKIEGDWLISHAETVKTFSQDNPPKNDLYAR